MLAFLQSLSRVGGEAVVQVRVDRIYIFLHFSPPRKWLLLDSYSKSMIPDGFHSKFTILGGFSHEFMILSGFSLEIHDPGWIFTRNA